MTPGTEVLKIAHIKLDKTRKCIKAWAKESECGVKVAGDHHVSHDCVLKKNAKCFDLKREI